MGADMILLLQINSCHFLRSWHHPLRFTKYSSTVLILGMTINVGTPNNQKPIPAQTCGTEELPTYVCEKKKLWHGERSYVHFVIRTRRVGLNQNSMQKHSSVRS